ncbi:hypothetical protein [Ferrovibrio terrae]|uniref:hypothetical protein n=1 Tax=Ferrovibrio terrae TaxID=2594003 RepID=UPI003137C81E
MFDFNLDVMSIAYVLVLAANLALILLVGNLTFERARDAWSSVASRTRYLQSGLDQLRAAAEHAETQTAEAAKNIEAAKQKLANAEVELAALKKRHAEEKLPFVYRVTPPENFDPGGMIWEFVAHHDNEGMKETDPDHPARQWTNGRFYLVQAATQKAAIRQLERHLPDSEGFRLALVKNHGDVIASFAEAV